MQFLETKGRGRHGARRCQRGLGVPRGEGAREAVAALGRPVAVGVEHRLRVVAAGAVGLGDPAVRGRALGGRVADVHRHGDQARRAILSLFC